MLQLSTVKHSVVLYTDTGQKVVLDGLITQHIREEHPNQLAQKVRLTLANRTTNGQLVSSLIKLASRFYIFANGTEVFRGIAWEWSPGEALNDELSLVLYDNLIYLQKSEDDQFYSAGLNTQTLLKSILKPLGIMVDYRWKSIAHAKKKYQARPFGDMIVDILEDVRKLGNGKYVLRGEAGKLIVDFPARNKEIYVFESTSSISTSMKMSMDNLVTKVIVYGRQSDDTRSPVETTLEGKTEFGLLQKVIYREQNQSLGEASAQAQTLLDDYGSPALSVALNAPDVPFLHKGDLIKAYTGLLSGSYVVQGVTHNVTKGSMDLELEKYKEAAKEASGSPADGNFQRGDSVVLNGPVYATSYGEGKGRTFEDYHTTITIVADTSRMCPYHCGSVGWAEPGSLTKEG